MLTEEKSSPPPRWDQDRCSSTGILELQRRQRLQLPVLETRGEAEQSAAADEGTKDTALLTLRPHQTCSKQLAD